MSSSITVPLAWRSGLQDDPTVAARDPVTVDVRLLCAAAYLSNILLIVTVAILAALLNLAYVALTSPALLLSSLLLLLVGITALVFAVKHESSLRWKNVLDREHATDFTFAFDVSSEVTQTSLFGLSAALFGSLKTTGEAAASSIRAAEALLVYAAVFGLAMMLACSMPPVVTNTRYGEKIANKFIRVAACLLVALVATAAFAAVVTLLQGYNTRRLYLRKPPPPAAGRGPAAGARHPSQFLRNHWNVVLWPGLYPAMFGALMAVYSQYNICQPLGKLYKTTVSFVFLAIVSNLARMVISREGGPRNEMRLVSVGVTVVSMALALFFIVLLVLLQRDEVRNTFFISSAGSYGGG